MRPKIKPAISRPPITIIAIPAGFLYHGTGNVISSGFAVTGIASVTAPGGGGGTGDEEERGTPGAFGSESVIRALSHDTISGLRIVGLRKWPSRSRSARRSTRNRSNCTPQTAFSRSCFSDCVSKRRDHAVTEIGITSQLDSFADFSKFDAAGT